MTTDSKAMPEKAPGIGIHTSSVIAQLQKSLGNRAMVQFLRNHAESIRPIQRIDDSEIETLVHWWDAWLNRAIEELSKKEIQIELDRMLRSKVPVAEGDHIPIKFRVPDERLKKQIWLSP